ncbi:MAG: DUF6050 family protein [Oscillospiraceae bacterium]|jgi:hypothetical protein|nr:DUF6050 family protein [Oscillospiraceae bacterium]
MTLKDIGIDFFKKVILPSGIILLIYVVSKIKFTDDNFENVVITLLICGFPFGVQQRFSVRTSYNSNNVQESVIAPLILITKFFIVGGLIGIPIMAWRLLKAVGYLFVTIFRLLRLNRG